jgi:hypothetical protein
MSLKTGNEHFKFDDSPLDFLLNDFWKWQASDLLNNTLRGALAEFIVAKALGIETNSPRIDWGPYDLLFFGRGRIEVKSSAYVQSWEQNRDSSLNFSIRQTRAWDSISGYEEEQKHQSDMYIFCVLNEKDRKKADPLILDQWDFYPALTSEIEELFPGRQSMGISSVCRICPEPYDYHSLRDAVLWLISARKDSEALNRIEEYNAQKRMNENKVGT